MDNIQNLITDNLHIWSTAIDEKKSGRGRGGANKGSIYGVKKLRELILDLAVRGKLVPQDPNDEPASELLKRIAAEKQELIKQGKLKKEKPLAPISDDEKPFDLPNGWEWVRNANLIKLKKGKIPKTFSDDNEGVPYLDIEALERNIVNRFTKDVSCPSSSEGDLLVVCDGSRSGLVLDGKNGIIGSTLAIIEHQRDLTLFIKLIFNHGFSRWNTSMKGAAIPHLDNKALLEEITALPTLSEQHRIVAKVDDLMKLCDALEAGIIKSFDVHGQLVETLLNGLCNAQNNDDFNSTWQIIYNNFETLFTTEESIEKLKQSILQLAIMGKLVPQDPNDEPASELLKRIQSAQNVRIKSKEIQKPKEVKPSSEPEIKCPNEWIIKPLGELAFVTKLAGFEYTEHFKLKETGDIPVVRAQNVRPFHLSKNSLKYIDLETSNKLNRCALDRPCLLVTFIGAGIGDVCAFDEKTRWHLAPNVAKVEPYAKINITYLTMFLNSPNGKHEIFKSMKSTAQPSLSMGTIREIWVPLPSIIEQTRIVAKVEELMSICDELKSKITLTNQTKITLANNISQQIDIA